VFLRLSLYLQGPASIGTDAYYCSLHKNQCNASQYSVKCYKTDGTNHSHALM